MELIGNDVLATLVGLVWLVGITNAFNLLDNMDGLAATLAAVACGYFAIDAATLHEDELVLVLSLSLGFACLGFLPFNLRPRRTAAVFMGDSGSQVLGFMLAALGARGELDDGRNDGRDDAAAAARARHPDPRHDARHPRAARREAARDPGRARPHARTGSSTTGSPKRGRSRCWR